MGAANGCTLRTVRGLLYATVGLVLTALASGIVYQLAPAAEPSKPAVRSIAFDNVYGNVERLRVFVSVDNLAEQTVTATCDPTTCIFKLPLTNARHDLLLSVEQDGRRSQPTRVTVDTTAPAAR